MLQCTETEEIPGMRHVEMNLSNCLWSWEKEEKKVIYFPTRHSNNYDPPISFWRFFPQSVPNKMASFTHFLPGSPLFLASFTKNFHPLFFPLSKLFSNVSHFHSHRPWLHFPLAQCNVSPALPSAPKTATSNKTTPLDVGGWPCYELFTMRLQANLRCKILGVHWPIQVPLRRRLFTLHLLLCFYSYRSQWLLRRCLHIRVDHKSYRIDFIDKNHRSLTFTKFV